MRVFLGQRAWLLQRATAVVLLMLLALAIIVAFPGVVTYLPNQM